MNDRSALLVVVLAIAAAFLFVLYLAWIAVGI